MNKPTIAKGVPMVVRIRYNEPRVNQHNGSIINGVPRDWNKIIHSINGVPRLDFPHCTYCHQIGY
jgi:hypothetical protein